MSETKTITKIDDDNRKAMFDAAYSGSYYTIIGCGGPLSEWTEGYTQMLKEAGIGEPREFITFTGADMNTHYGLTGSNSYPGDVTFLMFPLDGLDCGCLAIFRLRARDKWFDDMVDNNRHRQDAINEKQG